MAYKITLILLVLLLACNASLAETSIGFMGIAAEGSLISHFGSDVRVWWDKNGIELYSGSSLFGGYSLTRFKYLQKISKNIYWGIGAGEAKYKPTSWGWFIWPTPASPTAEYTETPVYLCYGIEGPLYFDWFTGNAEIGYILSFVKNFSGDLAQYPQSRFYVSAGMRFKIRI